MNTSKQQKSLKSFFELARKQRQTVYISIKEDIPPPSTPIKEEDYFTIANEGINQQKIINKLVKKIVTLF